MCRFKITSSALPIETVKFLEIVREYGSCQAPPEVWNNLAFFQNPVVYQGLLDNRWDAFLIQDQTFRGFSPVAFFFNAPEKCWHGVLVKGKIRYGNLDE